MRGLRMLMLVLGLVLLSQRASCTLGSRRDVWAEEAAVYSAYFSPGRLVRDHTLEFSLHDDLAERIAHELPKIDQALQQLHLRS
jgi:hypothetical protein